MSVSCEIRLNDPDEPFMPGNVVAGIIAYTLKEEDVFKNIIISLRGNGHLATYANEKRVYKEDYVNINHYLFCDSQGLTQASGSYEKQFNFILPCNLPPSLDSGCKQTKCFEVQQCEISYFLYVQFGRPDHKSDTIFKRKITIGSKVIPRLPALSTTTYQQIKYPSCFKCKSNFIDTKATIDHSNISPGNVVRINCRIFNNSTLTVKDIEIKLIEVYTFKPESGREGKNSEDIVVAFSPRGQIYSGCLRDETIEITIPPNTGTMEGLSYFVSRSYIIKIIVKLPFPYRDAVLKIPIQVCSNTTCQNEEDEVDIDPVPEYSVAIQTKRRITIDCEEPPPSYSEIFGEVPPTDDAFGKMILCDAWCMKSSKVL